MGRQADAEREMEVDRSWRWVAGGGGGDGERAGGLSPHRAPLRSARTCSCSGLLACYNS